MKVYVLDKYRFMLAVAALVSSFAFLISCLIPLSAEEKHLPIYSVETDEPVVAITFDCAWSDEDIPSIIDTLASYECKATFFVVGSWAENYPDSVRLLSEAGHEIAGHSYNHAHYNALSEQELLLDMTKCDNVIKSLTGGNVPLFRAPYGEYNNAVVKTAENSGRTLIQWDVDSLDWKDLTEEDMLKRILPKVQNGSIILLHNGTKNTASALPAILQALRQEGYHFKSVGDLIYKDAYRINEQGRQIPS